jgi:DNA (cytosine-5)-methyltransferase 1
LILDAFHGAGGWAEGLRLLGRSSLGVEYDPDMVTTSRAAGHDVVLADVAKIDPRELVSELAAGVDNRATTPMHDERSRLTCEPMRWVNLLNPEWVALEQVPAVLPVWEDMAQVLRARGYHAWAGVVHAERYGVPQTRKRAVMLAHKRRAVSEPTATHQRYYPPTTKLAANPPDAHLPRWVSMAQALGWGMTARPYPAVACSSSTGGPDMEKVGGSGARRTLYEEQEAGRWAGTFRSYGRPNQGGTREDGEWLPAFVPGMHHANDGRKSDAVKHSRSRAIRLSLEEAATIQTFRRDYPWHGTSSKRFMQIGNAVPPVLARALLSELTEAGGRVNLAAFGI